MAGCCLNGTCLRGHQKAPAAGLSQPTSTICLEPSKENLPAATCPASRKHSSGGLGRSIKTPEISGSRSGDQKAHKIYRAGSTCSGRRQRVQTTRRGSSPAGFRLFQRWKALVFRYPHNACYHLTNASEVLTIVPASAIYDPSLEFYTDVRSEL